MTTLPLTAGLLYVAKLEATIEGKPVPQGSMRHVGNGRMIHKPHMLEHRERVAIALKQASKQVEWKAPVGYPVFVNCRFVFPRPASHWRQKGGKPTEELRSTADRCMVKRPDKDKLERLVFDALTMAQVVADDSQIVGGGSVKEYATSPSGNGYTVIEVGWVV